MNKLLDIDYKKGEFVAVSAYSAKGKSLLMKGGGNNKDQAKS